MNITNVMLILERAKLHIRVILYNSQLLPVRMRHIFQLAHLDTTCKHRIKEK